MKELYSVEFWGEDGSNFSYRVAIVYANTEEEAQDLAGIRENERGFFPTRKISTVEYLKELENAKKEYHLLKNIVH